MRGELGTYKELGELDDIRGHVQIASRIAERAVEMATNLGYTEAEVREALANDPEGTLAFLRQKASEDGAKPPDIGRTIQQELDRRLRPIQEREEARRDAEANYAFDKVFDAHTKTLWKDEDLPKEERDILRQVASEMMSYDEAAVKRLRLEGKTSDVARYVDQARAFLDKYFIARSQREQKRAGTPRQGTGAPPPTGKRPSLDDIISDPSVLGSKYA